MTSTREMLLERLLQRKQELGTWRLMAAELDRYGKHYDGATWSADANRKQQIKLVRENILRRWQGLPERALSPLEQIEQIGTIDEVHIASERGNAALIYTSNGKTPARVRIYTDDEATGIAVEHPHNRSKHRNKRLGTWLSLGGPYSDRELKTRKGRTGNLETIKDTARRAAQQADIGITPEQAFTELCTYI